MLSTSTIQILKSLSLKELKRFRDFIKSPYFNTTTALEKIFEVVLESRPNYDLDSLKYENISKVIFPTGEYKEKRIRNLYSEFGNLLRKFLGYEEMQSYKNYELDILIADAMTRKNLFEIAEKFIHKSLLNNESSVIIDDLNDLYKHRILCSTIMINTQEFKHSHFDRLRVNYEALVTQFMRNAFTNTDIYSSEYQTRSSDELSTEKKNEFSFNDAYLQSLDINKFLNLLKQSNHKFYSYLKIHYMLYYFSSNSINNEQFYELKNEIFKIIPNIHKDDAYVMILRMHFIICGKLLNTDKKFNNELFELGKFFCGLKIFPNDSIVYMHLVFFTDLFTNAMILKEYDWAEDFINEFINYIGIEHRENEYNYCHGILNFKRGKFEESLNFFNEVKPLHITHKVSIRYYMLMNYIELKAFESARSSVLALKEFKQNQNKEIPDFIERIMDSLKYFNEIIRCEEQGIKIDEMIYKEANDGRNFTHKAYILEKMEKLK
ncbi:hypothetical protein BH10BAC5_BH10BAC5_12540 [soil metagenome]